MGQHDDMELHGTRVERYVVVYDRKERECVLCEKKLSGYNPNKHCFACTAVYIEKQEQVDREEDQRRSVKQRKAAFVKLHKEFFTNLAYRERVPIAEIIYAGLECYVQITQTPTEIFSLK